MSSIFVSVAAFCDPWLVQTVRDACAKAEHPERLVFGVFEQDTDSRQAELQSIVHGHNAKLRYLDVHPAQSRGVSWARSAVFSLYQGEDYLLQIDSHMLFEPQWDRQLLFQYTDLLRTSSKPIISVYPWGFEMRDDVATPTPSTSQATLVLRPVPSTVLHPNNVTIRFHAEQVLAHGPVLGCHLAGGFIFTSGDFVQQVPYDPYMYFYGEEQSLSLRAWTKGWDIWHPMKIPIYHLYKQPNQPNRGHHWHVDWESLRDYKHYELTALSTERLVQLVDCQANLGVYGLGAQRTLEEYARFAGINYAQRKFVQEYRDVYTWQD